MNYTYETRHININHIITQSTENACIVYKTHHFCYVADTNPNFSILVNLVLCITNLLVEVLDSKHTAKQ